MASEANMVEVKEKGKGKEEPQPQPQLQPQTEETAHQTVVPPVPTATPPAAPEKDLATLPAIPPMPPQKEASLRPLPPSHPATRGQGQEHPQPFPIGYYDPDHVHPDERELANPPGTRWYFLELVLSTLSLIFSAIMVGLGLAIASWGGRFWEFSNEEINFGVTCATVCDHRTCPYPSPSADMKSPQP